MPFCHGSHSYGGCNSRRSASISHSYMWHILWNYWCLITPWFKNLLLVTQWTQPPKKKKKNLHWQNRHLTVNEMKLTESWLGKEATRECTSWEKVENVFVIRQQVFGFNTASTIYKQDFCLTCWRIWESYSKSTTLLGYLRFRYQYR